jgi:hypothetical protein
MIQNCEAHKIISLVNTLAVVKASVKNQGTKEHKLFLQM